MSPLTPVWICWVYDIYIYYIYIYIYIFVYILLYYIYIYICIYKCWAYTCSRVAADQILLIDKVAQNSCSLSLSVLRQGGGSGGLLLDKSISDSPSLVGVGKFFSAMDSRGSREHFSTAPSSGSQECGVLGRLTRVTGNCSPGRNISDSPSLVGV